MCCCFLITSSFLDLLRKKNQLPRVTVVPPKGSSADVSQTSKSHKLQTAPSGAGPPPLPPPGPLRLCCNHEFQEKEIKITKHVFLGVGKSQLQTRYAATLRHDKGREGWGDQKKFFLKKKLKKTWKNLFKSTHFTLTPPTFHHLFQFLCATSLTMSIFSPSPPPTILFILTATTASRGALCPFNT